MAEREARREETARDTSVSSRRPDLVTLTAGLVTLAAAVLTLGGWAVRLPDPRWVLAAVAVLVGLLLLGGGRAGGRRGRSRRP